MQAAPIHLPPNPPPVALPELTAMLDNRQEWCAFSRELDKNEGCWESSVVFEGMHCAACALTIEDALCKVPGVLSVQVSAASYRGRVVWSEHMTRPSVWMDVAQKSGYRALPANDVLTVNQRRTETRLVVWRLGVAGLCMMQVMMYAWPAYVTQAGEIPTDMVQLLRWASWVLSLPVLLFSCAPFFTNALRDLRQRRISMDLPVALGMAITFAVSSLGTFEPQGVFGKEVFFDSFTMFVFFLLAGRWLELRLRDRTAGALEALMNRLPESVERRNADGSFERVAVRRLAVGDVLRVLPGETFPADGTIVQGRTLADEALLTGESRPLPRAEGATVIAGSHNLLAAVLLRVERMGTDTRFAQIVALMQVTSTSKPAIAQLADRIAKPFLGVVLLAASAAGLWWWGVDPTRAWMVAVSVLIVTCPCALSLGTPVAMLASAGSLARRGVLVRRLQALETLAKVDTVVFDKTGTLTHDRFTLGDVHTRSGVCPSQALAMASVLAQHSLHPVSRALAAAAQADTKAGYSSWTADTVRESPGQGISGQLLASYTHQRQEAKLGSAAFCGVTPQQGQTVQAYLSDSQGWVASFTLHEQLRSDACNTVAQLQALGVQVHLLSGDQAASVMHVAQQTGIELAHSACTPQDKLMQLRLLQNQGRTVAMVGDGLNDGPVLAGAHVSFAFGQAVPLAQAQSDFVVLGQRLTDVVSTLLLARRTLRIVKQNLTWALVYNAICVPLALAGWLPAWLAGLGMALSSLAVVLNALRLSAAISPSRVA